MRRFSNALLRLISPLMAFLTFGYKSRKPPIRIQVEAMPVRVAISDENAPTQPEQHRTVAVCLDCGFVPGQEFSVAYEVRNQLGQLVQSNSVILPPSPPSWQPAAPSATSFTFEIAAKKKAAAGSVYTVRVRVSFKATNKLSTNSFEASP